MKNSISIGTVEMPLTDFVVSRNAILGITKSGKTFCAKGIAEQLLEMKIPIIVFDAIGMWRFLKVPSGKPGGKGFPIVVAGGAQPDLPLNPHTAPQIVRAAIQQNISLVIDLYDPNLSKADWRRIVQDCFRILLFENKGLRHIFLEEAAEYVPQKVMDGQTYAEVEKLARMGGNASLGITFINPRAQELNKAVLELCDNIVLLRQRGTHAIDSLEKQMDKLSPDMAQEIALTMPNMTQGDCWVFTENGDKPIRTRSAQIKSFHPDRRNPEANKVMGTAVNTDQFVSALSGQLEKVVKEAKENDPAVLKKRIRELESQQGKVVPGKIEKVDVPALTDAERKRLTKLIQSYDNCYGKLQVAQNILDNAISTLQDEREIKFFKNLLTGKLSPPPQRIAQQSRPFVKSAVPVVRRTVAPVSGEAEEDRNPNKCERAILSVLAQFPNGRTTSQVAILSEYSINSSGFSNALSFLRTRGYITRTQPIQITPDGLNILGDYEPLPSGDALIRHWLSKLGKCERTILSALVKTHPGAMSSEELSSETGYSQNSSGFSNALSKLRTLELITRGQPMKASDEFFQ